MSVKQEFMLFLEERKESVCPKTIKSYISHYNALKQYFNEDEKLDEAVCHSLYKAVMQNQNITDYTKNSYLKSWKTFILWVNSDLPLPKLKKVDGQPKNLYTDEEIKRLLDKPITKSFSQIRGWAISCLLSETGIRASSLINIKSEDVDLDKNIITLRHTKNHKRMNVMFTSITASAIRYLKKFGEYEYLFTNEYGEQLQFTALKSLIVRYNNSRGVAKNSIHLYRHYFAKKYLEQTKDIYALKKLLGHQSISTTENYLKLYGELKDIYKSPVASLGKKKVTYMK